MRQYPKVYTYRGYNIVVKRIGSFGEYIGLAQYKSIEDTPTLETQRKRGPGAGRFAETAIEYLVDKHWASQEKKITSGSEAFWNR